MTPGVFPVYHANFLMTFLGDKKKCDLVMQGGVTSGIVYPGAACKLAEAYRFVNIGGTSAGAIAAAATAAAEYRRRTGDAAGFEELAKLPATLGGATAKGTKLFSLFQPDPYARKVFALAVAPLGKTKFAALFSVLWTTIRMWPYWWVVAAAAAIWTYVDASKVHSLGATIFFSILVFGLVLEPLLLLSLLIPILKMPKNGFGLCSGMTHGRGLPALTPWLTEFLQKLSGKPHDEPLTFGDLRAHDVKLRMISTCFTHGRPYGLPLDTNTFFFKEEEFHQYFPKEVVKWMVDHQGPPPPENVKDPVNIKAFCVWPAAKDLPVVVASRMSLSFPILFRAVPLYAIDYSLLRADQPQVVGPGSALGPNDPRTPERCWFIDGGICNNFPIDMFDGPIPRWPTFGIELEAERKDRPKEVVWMPETNNQGWGEMFTRIDENAGLGIIVWLLGIVDAARSWMNNRQVTVPGYRDRVVRVRLDDKSEGGLQLNMPPEVVAEVSQRGSLAGEMLLAHFNDPSPDCAVTWENHRWVRLRSMLALLEKELLDVKTGFEETEPGDQSYLSLLERDQHAPPNSYRLNPQQRQFTLDWLDRFSPLIDSLQTASDAEKFSKGEPRPLPVLRVIPRTASADNADCPDATPRDPRMEAQKATEPHA